MAPRADTPDLPTPSPHASSWLGDTPSATHPTHSQQIHRRNSHAQTSTVLRQTSGSSQGTSNLDNEQHEFPYWPPAPATFVTATLTIWPPDQERAFWRSATWLQSTRSLDKYFIAYTAVNNLTMLVYLRLLPARMCPHLPFFSGIYVTLAIVHSTLAARGCMAYVRWRPRLVLINRALRFANLLLDITFLHRSATCATCTATLQEHIRRPGVGLLSKATRSLLFVSWIFPTLAHTSYLRFPFLPQAACQLAYVLLLVRYISVPAAHLLNDPRFTPGLARLCHAINTLSFTAVSELTWLPATPNSPCAAPHAAWLLVLFVQLFLGLVLPLTLAYCFERRCKQRYIERELRVPVLQVYWGWEPVALGIKLSVVLGVYAALVWLLLKEYHRHILGWVVCLDWPGAQSQWYYDVMKGAA